MQMQKGLKPGPVIGKKLANELWPGGLVNVIDARPIGAWAQYKDISRFIEGKPVFTYHQIVGGSSIPTVKVMITEMVLWHYRNPVRIQYKINFEAEFEQGIPFIDITASGLFEASNRDIQKILPIVQRLRKGGDLAEPTSNDYDLAFDRLSTGKGWTTVKVDFLKTFNASSDAFNSAMYRRRQRIGGGYYTGDRTQTPADDAENNN